MKAIRVKLIHTVRGVGYSVEGSRRCDKIKKWAEIQVYWTGFAHFSIHFSCPITPLFIKSLPLQAVQLRSDATKSFEFSGMLFV